MCTTDIFPVVQADGTKTKTKEVRQCSAYRRGQPCEPVVYTHPSRKVAYPEANNTFLYPNMPPSPRHTPRNATPVYQSGEESERSNKSGGSSKKRSSGIYVNGTKVMDFNNNRKRASRGNERIVIVDSPPTPRTPPQTFAMPHTAPPSPNMNLPLPYSHVEAPRESSRRQPVIVDERPRPHVQIEVVDPRRHGHRRGHSNSSHHSHSSSNNTSDSERRRRRDDIERAQEELRRQKIRARINAANAEISRRPAVPVPTTPQRSSTTYIRPGVEVKAPNLERGHARSTSREQELVNAVRQLDLGRHMVADAERRARRSREREMDEDAAQRERLKERMMPRRRATVGPGSRRHRVLYDDGMYRWE